MRVLIVEAIPSPPSLWETGGCVSCSGHRAGRRLRSAWVWDLRGPALALRSRSTWPLVMVWLRSVRRHCGGGPGASAAPACSLCCRPGSIHRCLPPPWLRFTGASRLTRQTAPPLPCPAAPFPGPSCSQWLGGEPGAFAVNLCSGQVLVAMARTENSSPLFSVNREAFLQSPDPTPLMDPPQWGPGAARVHRTVSPPA